MLALAVSGLGSADADEAVPVQAVKIANMAKARSGSNGLRLFVKEVLIVLQLIGRLRIRGLYLSSEGSEPTLTQLAAMAQPWRQEGT